MRTGRRGVSRNTTSLCCPGSTKANRLNWTKRLNSFNPLSPLKARTPVDAEKWIALMKECVNPTELTAELLNTLIEKIVVHEAVKGEGRKQGTGGRNLLPLYRQD